MKLITREQIAKRTRPALGALGERPSGYALLGKGDGSGVIVKDAEYRLIYYYSEGQPPAFAPLSLNMSLVAINNSQMQGWRVRLGYPNYRPDVLHILSVDAVAGVAAGGGYTPDEQYTQSSQTVDVGKILNFRLSPNAPADMSIFVSAGYYYDADGNLAFFGGDLYDLTDTIGALSSGEHQLAVVSLDVSSGELALATNTAETGGSDNKDDFNETTIVELTYGDNDQQKGAVHLYYGQTAVDEIDIYRRADPRVPFTRPGIYSGSVQTTDATATTLKSFALAEGQIATLHGLVAGLRDDGSEAVGGTVMAVARRATGGNVTLVGSVDSSVKEDSSGSPTFTVDADTGTQTIRVRVTGEAAKTLNWTGWFDCLKSAIG